MASKTNFYNFVPRKARNNRTVFDNSNGQTQTTLFTPDPKDSIIYSISVYNSEDIKLKLNLFYSIDSVVEPFVQVEISNLAGAVGGTNPRQELITELNSQLTVEGNEYLLLPANCSLVGSLETLPTGSNKVIILIAAQDF